MRNLKRALSLGLASSMVLGTMAFSASAATSTSVTPTEVTTSFGDNDTIAPENVNAIYIAEQIGLTEGKDGGIFDPNGTVTRMEMAVICVNMKFGVDYATANFSEGDAANPQFSDLTWGYEFAKVAAQEGIIYGVGEDANGKMMFNPDGKVIAADALLMIMKTLGYFKNPAQEFAVDYKYAAGAQATELSLYDEKEYALIDELSREEVYAVAIRALTTCARVNYNYETGNYYNESSGYSSANLPNNYIIEDTLGYQKFDLKAVDDVDSFNRPTTLWTIGGRSIGNFVEDVHTDSNGNAMEFTTAKTYQEIAKELTAYTKTSNEDYYEYGIFVDGMEYSEWMDATGNSDKDAKLDSTTTLEGFNAVMDAQNTGHFLPSDNGVLTQVFVTDKVEYMTAQGVWNVEPGKVYVSCINTYLAEVDNTYDYDSGEYTTRVSYYSNKMVNSNEETVGLKVNTKEIDSTVTTYEGFEDDDIVMVQASAKGLTSEGHEKGFSGEMQIITIDEAIAVEGRVTYEKSAQDYVGGAYLVLDADETYNYSVAMRGDLDSNSDTLLTPSVTDDVVLFLDGNEDENGNGYILGYTKIEEAPKYLYVEENYDWTYYGGVVARVTFANGDEEEISITQIDGEAVTGNNQGQIPGNARFEDGAGNTISANENYEMTWTNGVWSLDENVIVNRVFGYTQLSDGSYNLTTTIQDAYDADKGAKYGGLLEMTDPDGHGTLNKTSADSEETKDTMAIFTSVYAPEDAYKDSDENKTAMEEYTPANNASETGGQYSFVFEKNYNSAWVLDINTDPDDGDGVYKGDDYGSYVDDSGWDPGDTEYDHLFGFNRYTVFVDVVGGAVWTGEDNAHDLDDYNVNMQVVFGNDGLADVVFLNNGVDPTDTGDYIIIRDTQPESWEDEDGNIIYKYNTYENGVEDFFLTKNSEVKITDEKGFFGEDNKDKLNVNTLYYVSEKDADGYVRTIDYRYDYSPLASVLYTEADYTTNYGDGNTNKIYNKQWSVAKVVSGNYMSLWHEDSFADGKGSNAGMYDDETYTGENVFSYTDSTVFVVLDTNKNGEIVSVKAGSDSDIKTYSGNVNDSSISWVDVVKASNSGTAMPKAELVVIVNPYDTGSSSTQTGEYDIVVTDTGFGSGTFNSPNQLAVEYFGAVPTDSATLIEIRDQAIVDYIENVYPSTYTTTIEVVKSTTDSTTWSVEIYNANGTFVALEYYTLNNDNIEANYKYEELNDTHLDNLVTLGLLTAKAESAMIDDETLASITYDITVADLFALQLAENALNDKVGEYVVLALSGVGKEYISGSDLLEMQLWEFFTDDPTTSTLGVVLYDGSSILDAALTTINTSGLNKLHGIVSQTGRVALVDGVTTNGAVTTYLDVSGDVLNCYGTKATTVDTVFTVEIKLVAEGALINWSDDDLAYISVEGGEITEVTTAAEWEIDSEGSKISLKGTKNTEVKSSADEVIRITVEEEGLLTFGSYNPDVEEAAVTFNGEETGSYPLTMTVGEYILEEGLSDFAIINGSYITIASDGTLSGGASSSAATKALPLFVSNTAEVYTAAGLHTVTLPNKVTVTGKADDTSVGTGRLSTFDAWTSKGSTATSEFYVVDGADISSLEVSMTGSGYAGVILSSETGSTLSTGGNVLSDLDAVGNDVSYVGTFKITWSNDTISVGQSDKVLSTGFYADASVELTVILDRSDESSGRGLSARYGGAASANEYDVIMYSNSLSGTVTWDLGTVDLEKFESTTQEEGVLFIALNSVEIL